MDLAIKALSRISKRRVHAILSEPSGRLKVSRVVTVGAVTIHMLKRVDVEKYRPFVRGRAGRPPKGASK